MGDKKSISSIRINGTAQLRCGRTASAINLGDELAIVALENDSI